MFIDEARSLWDYDADRANALVYQGRHRGLLFFILAQRAKMIPPNARNQCSKVIAFRQSDDDAKLLSSFNDALIKCNQLQSLEYIITDGFRWQQCKIKFD